MYGQRRLVEMETEIEMEIEMETEIEMEIEMETEIEMEIEMEIGKEWKRMENLYLQPFT